MKLIYSVLDIVSKIEYVIEVNETFSIFSYPIFTYTSKTLKFSSILEAYLYDTNKEYPGYEKIYTKKFVDSLKYKSDNLDYYLNIVEN